MPRLALVLVLLVLAVAGCTTPSPGSPNGNSTTPVTDGTSQSTYTPDQAKALLANAANDFPPQFGFDMTVKNGSKEAMSMKGLFDNASKTSYIDMKIDPAALGDAAGGSMGMSTLFANGMVIYETPKASVWIMNGTAFAIPPGDASKEMFGGQDPTASLKDLSDPHKLFANFTGSGSKDNDSTIKSVTPTVYKNKPAVSIASATVKNGTTYNATIIVYTNPVLPAHIEGQFPPEVGMKKNDALTNGVATMDFYYGSEVTTKVPDSAARALGLAYKSDSSSLSMMGGSSSAHNSTWTFLVSGGVATKDAVLEVKNASSAANGMSSPGSATEMPTLWSMKLSDATATNNGVTLAFADNDHDGKVSMGDQVTISWPDGDERPNVVLKDSVSGLYVVPGASAFLALAALTAVAIALRRK